MCALVANGRHRPDSSGSSVASIQLNPGPLIKLELEGDITIALAAQLKRELSVALEMGRDVSISLERVSMLDITAVQLLWAARRHAMTTAVAFTLDAIPKEIIARANEAGLREAFLVEGES